MTRQSALATAAGAVAAGFTITLVPAAATVLWAFLLALGILAVSLRLLTQHSWSVRRWVLISFAVHLVIGLVVLHWPNAVQYMGPDAQGYHADASAIAMHWRGDGPLPALPPGKEGYAYLLALVYVVGSPSWEAGLVINASLAAALVAVLVRVTAELTDRQAAERVAPLVTLLPGLVIWPAQLLREAGIFLLLALSQWGGVRLFRRINPLRLAALGLALSILLTFRAPVAVAMGAGLVVGLMLVRGAKGAGAGAGGAVAAAVLVAALGIGASGLQWSRALSLERLNDVRRDSAQSASSGFAPEEDISSTRRALSYLPIGLPAFLFGPPPWQVRGARQLPAVADALVWWALLPSLARGLRSAWRRRAREVLIVVVPALCVAAGLALGIANFGTVVRQRNQVLVLLLPIIAVGLAERRPWRVVEGQRRSVARHSLAATPAAGRDASVRERRIARS